MATASSTVYTHITKNVNVCGGKACIDETRIRVMDIVALQREGRTPGEMLDAFAVPLTLAQVHAALAYYYDHAEEVEDSFANQNDAAEASERSRSDFLNKHDVG